ncbi:MAG: asparaginase domain-containing protein [Bacteroidota bacterium]
MKIVFLQTGGTIDKDYPRSTKGWAFEFGEPASRRILERLSPSFEFDVVTICQKDSLEIGIEDRQKMANFILSSEASHFVLTHGTDTLIDTAMYLSERIEGKQVVLCGAMRPERFRNSDAAINLGCAIGAVQVLPAGVYVAMHGIVKEAHTIQRNLTNGQFY